MVGHSGRIRLQKSARTDSDSERLIFRRHELLGGAKARGDGLLLTSRALMYRHAWWRKEIKPDKVGVAVVLHADPRAAVAAGLPTSSHVRISS